ncbi:hypothetical protein BC834DRAFT_303590 [Gloeopeniophorella convolvens]|nr:hypothetical protein BC834DRAFT_303590 [Gloeopeniophorella convolvens]
MTASLPQQQGKRHFRTTSDDHHQGPPGGAIRYRDNGAPLNAPEALAEIIDVIDGFGNARLIVSRYSEVTRTRSASSLTFTTFSRSWVSSRPQEAKNKHRRVESLHSISFHSSST